MHVTFDCTRDSLSTIERLKAHFDRIEVRKLTTPLTTDNVVDIDCEQYVFTDCKGE